MSHWLGGLLLTLLFCHRGHTVPSFCPYRCHCFSSVQVLCDDERMSSFPENLPREVREVVVMTSSVVYLFAHSLQHCPQLTKLVFLNNALRSIHQQAFEGLSELQELEISGNSWLEHLYLGTFAKQVNLTKLILNFNMFKTVLPGIFGSLEQLEVLQMKGNILSDLPPFLFSNLSMLQFLDLSQNRLHEVTSDTFCGLEKLKILKFGSNLISNISADHFLHIPHLTELHLDGNKILQLQEGVFSRLANLSVLNLRGNLLSSFSDTVFGPEPKNLRELNLKANRLMEVSSLSRLGSLTQLYLSTNLLHNLSGDIFSNLMCLESLDLSENQLSFLPKTIFRGLLNITVMNLHKNNITQVDASLFEDQPSMERLHLSDNLLETLPEGLLEPFVLQHTVRLHGNPWRCDCHLWYLHDWLLLHSREVEMLDRTACASPEFLRGRAMASVGRDQLLCDLTQDSSPALNSCSLQTSNNTLLIKCRVKNCSPLTVRLQLEEEGGRVTDNVIRGGPESSQCSNETINSSID